MCAEAAVLGVPTIEFDDWYSDFKQYDDFNEKYKLIFGFDTKQEEKMYEKIELLLNTKNLKQVFQSRREKMLEDMIDTSAFLIWILSDYPKSIKAFFSYRSIQQKFK